MVPLGSSAESAPAPAWSPGRRVLFRFAFAYLILYSFPFPMGWVPGTARLAQGYETPWRAVVPWVGEHVLRLDRPITIFTNGSGDTTYDYVKLLCVAVLAVLAALVWTLADTGSRGHERLHDALRVYVRYVLALAMLSYGMSKVIKLQFPFPSLERLTQPYGDSSPMGLLWTFMGYSTAYNVFAGAGEVLGGILLFWRRTTTLGALIVMAVTANIVMLNFSYDVPVKLYSLNLLGMAVFLVLPEVQRLTALLVLNCATAPATLRPFPGVGRKGWAGRILKTAVVLYAGYAILSETLEGSRMYGPAAPRSRLYGMYEVEEFITNGETLPPTLAQAARWRRVIVGQHGTLWVRRMDDVRQRYLMEIDQARRSLTLTPFEDRTRHSTLTYDRPDEDHLVLAGTLDADVLAVRLRRMSVPTFPLVDRGFHWINEYPYNR